MKETEGTHGSGQRSLGRTQSLSAQRALERRGGLPMAISRACPTPSSARERPCWILLSSLLNSLDMAGWGTGRGGRWGGSDYPGWCKGICTDAHCSAKAGNARRAIEVETRSVSGDNYVDSSNYSMRVRCIQVYREQRQESSGRAIGQEYMIDLTIQTDGTRERIMKRSRLP
jgi:hypothetical protein